MHAPVIMVGMQDVRADPLRLTICPGCGYSLVGAEAGAVPPALWKLRTGADEPVDAEVECTSEVAAAVRERVRGWVGRGMR